jgi:hypothetical protein
MNVGHDRSLRTATTYSGLCNRDYYEGAKGGC